MFCNCFKSSIKEDTEDNDFEYEVKDEDVLNSTEYVENMEENYLKKIKRINTSTKFIINNEITKRKKKKVYTILNIEDNELHYDIMKFILHKNFDLKKFKIFNAKNIKDAIIFIEKNNPDLILLDRILENNENGLDILNMLIERDFDCKNVAIVSVVSELKEIIPVMKLGIYGYLIKPIDSTDFKKLINTFFDFKN